MARREIIIKDTHRGLWYEDGVLKNVVEAGRYKIPRKIDIGFYRTPKIEVVLVDIRERDLTIKGQEILTSDKVAIRVSIIVQFRVVEPQAALHKVENRFPDPPFEPDTALDSPPDRTPVAHPRKPAV